MCNPPFFVDAAEMYLSARSRNVEPFSVSARKAREIGLI